MSSGEQFAPIDKPYMKLYQERMSDPKPAKPVKKRKKGRKKARK